MAERSIMVPGPDHPITIEVNPSRVVVTIGGKSSSRRSRDPADTHLPIYTARLARRWQRNARIQCQSK